MSVYYGESKCEGLKADGIKCANSAYYLFKGKHMCGVHSKQFGLQSAGSNGRTKLTVNPNAKKNKIEKYKKHMNSVKIMANQNKKYKKRGHVIVSKFKMMRVPEQKKGYYNVYPNFKHQNRSDGLGCSKLSPMSLGPVNHVMPNLPPAKNIENYHQFSKFWDFEFKDDELIKFGLVNRTIAYRDHVPHRHKYARKFLKGLTGNANVPTCSIHYDKNGKERRYTYLQSRYFYCHYYERLAKKEPQYIRLVKYINDGYNLNIVGYDGYDVTNTLWKYYNDISRPFGHELVLYTLLTVNDSRDYPWNEYRRKNPELYKNMF